MRRRPVRPFVAAALAVAQTGCTEALWQAANEETARCQSVVGTIDTPVGRRVLIRYAPFRTQSESELLSIPLDNEGRPVSPFTLPGTGQKCEWDDLNTVAADVRAARVEEVDVDRAAVRPVIGPAWSPDAMPTAAHLFGEGERGIYVMPYLLTPSGQMAIVPLDRVETNGAFQYFRVPAGAALLLIPASVRRPEAARTGAQLRAACLTPLTLTADVAQAAAPGALLTITVGPFAAVPMLLFVYGVSSYHSPPTTQQGPVVPSGQ